jgi:hypothetical protein
MPSYEIRLTRTLTFWGLSKSGKPRWRRVRSRLTILVHGVQDEASWQRELDRISQEFDLGNTWKLLSSRPIVSTSDATLETDEPGDFQELD